MSVVWSEQSYEELQAYRLDNVDYDDDGSLEKARLYKNATRALLTFALRQSEHAGERIELEPEILERDLKAVERWISIRVGQSAPLPVFQPAPCWRDE